MCWKLLCYKLQMPYNCGYSRVLIGQSLPARENDPALLATECIWLAVLPAIIFFKGLSHKDSNFTAEPLIVFFLCLTCILSPCFL